MDLYQFGMNSGNTTEVSTTAREFYSELDKADDG